MEGKVEGGRKEGESLIMSSFINYVFFLSLELYGYTSEEVEGRLVEEESNDEAWMHGWMYVCVEYRQMDGDIHMDQSI